MDLPLSKLGITTRWKAPHKTEETCQNRKKFERGDYTLIDIIQMVLASGWVSVCSVYSAIIHFLNSDIIMLNVLKSKCRRNGSKTKWE